MTNHLLFALLGAAALFPAAPASAADRAPGAERPLVLQERGVIGAERHRGWGAPPPPHGRVVNGGPGYVGSDYGLGKPAFTGLGSRPDWGHSE
jgi:hypothetical protein